jgi:decaprenylphospho-beta-D-ribofuranose 2-oxidase
MTRIAEDEPRTISSSVPRPSHENGDGHGSGSGPVAGRVGQLAGWGNVKVPGTEVRSEDLGRVARTSSLTRGLGRSYGDSSLPAPGDSRVAGSALADRILAFDARTGVLRAEAGFTLRDMNRIFLERGWFTPVSPGTKFVTLGGMVASDVHGKNHHREGTFGEHVRSLRVCLSDGRIVDCSRTEHPDLFRATIGGMGLTGHILEVECVLERIPSPWIFSRSRRVADLDDFVEGLDRASEDWPFTMGWVDCVSRGRAMGRGILICGRWARPDEAPAQAPKELRKLSVPFTLPSWAINRFTVRAFNELYYRAHPKHERQRIVHPDKFFYPLDAIHAWNRVYGARGFTQYQCVLPDVGSDGSGPRPGSEALHALMDVLTRSGAASPLCVIKNCGDEGIGMLSFPKRGISVAADFPISADTPALVDALNEIVIAHGGRIYLTKDTFTRAEHFRAMEPRLPAWLEVRRRWDPEGRLRSHQSVRLFGDAP